MFSHNWPLRGPSQEDITTPVYDLDQFQNSLPQTLEKPHNFPLTRPIRHDTSTKSVSVQKQESRFRTLFWPTVAITIPIALLSATLLTLVFAYRVKSEPSLFKDGGDDPHGKHNTYVLVNFSASKSVNDHDICDTNKTQLDLSLRRASFPQWPHCWPLSS